ncbi:MAG TPA: serine hydrolase domain-containing protein [Pyrinomonadaceae bacterium]|nr:serine hydrolase domain-containing protein [Pyrinomonadaceae bacterium]
MRFRSCIVAILLFSLVSFGQAPDKDKVIAGAERAFEKASKANAAPAPGCAVGVSLNGQSVFEKAFGLAEMEHNIPNTPQTIFESGSVAKQFTAAALVLLQQDGKLSIDDPVRKYVTEFPDYGKPLTIRHILNHTAGLRDWGSVMALTGAGRGDRVVTQDIALDVIVRQKSLDFEPGAEYSYSNSGYQLAAIIVERVSGKKFSEFVAERIFKPLGMTNSSWRDDYRRLVIGRAQGYSKSGPNSPWMLNMPIMNVYGNGGMLTTVGDWLKWNAALDAKTMGAPFVEALETQGVLNDGRKISYALGLDVGSYKGIKEVAHSGGTAGYQTYLARFPEKKLSVAALCNGYPPSSGDVVYSVVDEIFGPFPAATEQKVAMTVSEEQLKKYVGTWKNEKTRNPNQIAIDKGELKINGGPLKPIAEGAFMLGDRKAKFIPNKEGVPERMEIANTDGSITKLVFEREWKPTAADLNEFAGEWYSEEAQSRISIKIENDNAFLILRPVARFQLKPVYKDAFSAQGYVMWFPRDKSGKVTEMHVGTGRMRDMLFVRVK